MKNEPGTPAPPQGEQGRVLIVDDIETNTRLLTGILRVAGFTSISASSGQEALDKLEAAAPDVVLLDVMMPDMDGFEVCRRIRAGEKTAWLPVVMVTALQDTEHRVAALEAGADDFLTKPVDGTEVTARVQSLVRVKRQREQLERAYADLRRAEEMREGMTAMLVHDLRTPLSSVIGAMSSIVIGEDGQEEFQKELLNIALRGGQRLLSMINDLLDVSKMESGQMQLRLEPIPLDALLSEAMEQVHAASGSLPGDGDTGARIERVIEAALPSLEGDRNLFTRVLVNLIANALKFSPAREKVTSTVSEVVDEASTSARQLKFLIRDNGPGIAPEDQAKVFDKFGQVEARQSDRALSTGLGLTFCKLAVEAHSGRIGLESELGKGSTFYFLLPTPKK